MGKTRCGSVTEVRPPIRQQIIIKSVLIPYLAARRITNQSQHNHTSTHFHSRRRRP